MDTDCIALQRSEVGDDAASCGAVSICCHSNCTVDVENEGRWHVRTCGSHRDPRVHDGTWIVGRSHGDGEQGQMTGI